MHPEKTKIMAARAALYPHCAECVQRDNSPEVYSVVRNRDHVVLAFDIELAVAICQDGRKPLLVPREDLAAILQVNGITEEHVNHVDITLPGIAAPVEFMPSGQPVMGLIDGSHRATRCFREGRDFFAYQLTPKEALQCQSTVVARTAQTLETMLRGSRPELFHC